MMKRQLKAVKESAFCRACGWLFRIDGLVVYVQLRPRGGAGASCAVRIVFDEFPRRAPSYVLDPWPPGLRQSDDPPGICTPGTREFHEHYHKNDRQYPWNHEVYTVLRTLAEIQRLMERHVKGQAHA